MSGHPALDTLRRAVGAHRAGQLREALALAEAAYRMTREIPGAPPQTGVVVSWYGYLLATVGQETGEGLKLCREAAENNFWEPRIYEHLARLEIAAGSRKRAVEALERGLLLAPDDLGLRSFRRYLGVRGRPPLPFLDRNNRLNYWLGLLRARLHRQR